MMTLAHLKAAAREVRIQRERRVATQIRRPCPKSWRHLMTTHETGTVRLVDNCCDTFPHRLQVGPPLRLAQVNVYLDPFLYACDPETKATAHPHVLRGPATNRPVQHPPNGITIPFSNRSRT